MHEGWRLCGVLALCCAAPRQAAASQLASKQQEQHSSSNPVETSGGYIKGAPAIQSGGRMYTLQAHDGRWLVLGEEGPKLLEAKRPPATAKFKRVSDIYVQYGNRLLSAASSASEAPDITLAQWTFWARSDGRIALQSQAGGYLRPAEVGVKRGGKLSDEDVWWTAARPPSALTSTKVIGGLASVGAVCTAAYCLM